MWLKYKHKHASGIDKEWSWRDLCCSAKDAKAEAEEALEELAKEYDWSDKYRGMDYEIVEYPPTAIIKEEILSTRRQVRYLQHRVIELKAMLKSATVFEIHNS